MMRGTKRFARSEPDPVINDPVSKRILAGSPFDANRAEPSLQQQGTTPPLDTQRAELSRQHVRALNAQFASWVQTQLQNHPDELWEDGVQDYLSHASNIMEKFSDVVNWLKAANAAKGESLSALGSNAAQKTLASESKENDKKSAADKPGIAPASSTVTFGISWSSGAQNNLLFGSKETDGKSSSDKPGIAPAGTTVSFGSSWSSGAPKNILFGSKETDSKLSPDKPGITQAGTTASFGNSWSSGVFLNNKSPFSFGSQASLSTSQNSVPLNNMASNEEDGEEDVERPSSPSVKKTEEKGILVVHEVKCKLYVKSSDPADKDSWKDKGMGQLSIKCKEGFSKGSKEAKPTIIVRNDVGRILLNALLYPGIKTNMQKNAVVAIFHTSDDADNDNVVARTFLIRTKTEEDRNKLAAVIQEHAPAA